MSSATCRMSVIPPDMIGQGEIGATRRASLITGIANAGTNAGANAGAGVGAAVDDCDIAGP